MQYFIRYAPILGVYRNKRNGICTTGKIQQSCAIEQFADQTAKTYQGSRNNLIEMKSLWDASGSAHYHNNDPALSALMKMANNSNVH